MTKLAPKAKRFLKLWADMSPYDNHRVRVVSIKNDYQIYFLFCMFNEDDGFRGKMKHEDVVNNNIGRYEYRCVPGDPPGFEVLEDGVLYKLLDLIKE